MIFRPANATRNAMLNAIRNLIDAGSTGGTITFYGGTQPANGDTATGESPLAVLTFSVTSAPDAVGGVLTFSAITQDASADATGTATWARIKDSAGNAVFDCDVTLTGGGGLIQLSTVSLSAGATVSISSFTLTQPAS